MFKTLRDLEKAVADITIVEPTIEDIADNSRAKFIGVLDDPELQRIHSAIRTMSEDFLCHAVCLTADGGEADSVTPYERREMSGTCLSVAILRELFLYALKTSFWELREIDSRHIWICKGWKVYLVEPVKQSAT